MREFIDLGVTTPSDEDCAQLGSKSYDYYERARRKARALINQLRRLLGSEPSAAQLGMKSHQHDFGMYLTVVCHYDVEDPLAAAYAERCDVECPREWDEAARIELSLNQERR